MRTPPFLTYENEARLLLVSSDSGDSERGLPSFSVQIGLGRNFLALLRRLCSSSFLLCWSYWNLCPYQLQQNFCGFLDSLGLKGAENGGGEPEKSQRLGIITVNWNLSGDGPTAAYLTDGVAHQRGVWFLAVDKKLLRVQT